MTPIQAVLKRDERDELVTLIDIKLDDYDSYYGLVVKPSGKIEEARLQDITVLRPQKLFDEAKG